jgi:sulfatase maturation enzyme AslB (radical SAM superfamily)
MPSTDVNNLTLPPYASTMERLHFITADPNSHWESFHTKRATTPQSEALTVIVETGLECDLACTYCYQSGYGSLRKIRRSSSERQAIFHSILDQWGESHPDARRLYRGDPVKILSNGDLVSCDAQTHSSPQPAPGRLRSLIQLLPKSQSTRPCSDCIEFGLCGGEYFCKSGDVDGMLDPCDYLAVDLDDYLRFFVQAFLDAPDRVRLPMEQ